MCEGLVPQYCQLRCRGKVWLVAYLLRQTSASDRAVQSPALPRRSGEAYALRLKKAPGMVIDGTDRRSPDGVGGIGKGYVGWSDFGGILGCRSLECHEACCNTLQSRSLPPTIDFLSPRMCPGSSQPECQLIQMPRTTVVAENTIANKALRRLATDDDHAE